MPTPANRGEDEQISCATDPDIFKSYRHGLSMKLAALMDEAEADAIAFRTCPKSHWPKLLSTDPIERLNKEMGRPADVIGIFPDEASIRRLVGAIPLERNHEWRFQHRYMTPETTAGRSDEPSTALLDAA